MPADMAFLMMLMLALTVISSALSTPAFRRA
jgi:hypothetical protein